ncbi:MAG: FIST C-terminal domain-containing protein [Planctomycetota bacterium]|nr:FIST C-terminal domain-containing protein [Planctomycetota bacterium]
MNFASLVSRNESSTQAVAEVIDQAKKSTAGKIDVVFAFLTGHHAEEAEAIAEKLWLELDPQALIGVTGEGIIGQDIEIENAPGIALLAGDMPGVRLHPFHISGRDWKTLLSDPDALAERMGHNAQTRAVIAFGDPFTTPINELMIVMNQSMPHSPLVGGMASAARTPGGNALLKNDQVYADGLVGLSLSGPIKVQTVVSQGCRPIGHAMVITRGHDNIIEQLGGKPSLAALADMVQELPAAEQQFLHDNGLMIGRVISEYKEHFGRGDFLIRSLSGVDQKSGAIAVGELVRVGQTVQFHVHDAQSAHEDLELMLQPTSTGAAPPAALLFSCNGRGSRLFETHNHDVGVARSAMPQTPIAGFFAAGELGPVGEKNFLHGHTASFALLRPE